MSTRHYMDGDKHLTVEVDDGFDDSIFAETVAGKMSTFTREVAKVEEAIRDRVYPVPVGDPMAVYFGHGDPLSTSSMSFMTVTEDKRLAMDEIEDDIKRFARQHGLPVPRLTWN